MGGFDWAAIWYAVPYMAKGALVTLEISACAGGFGPRRHDEQYYARTGCNKAMTLSTNDWLPVRKRA
jgi:hypothetical protein